MFGKLSLDAVPFHEPIVMVTIAGIILGGLALVGLITYFGKWTYLWKEWLTSVDHKRLGIMYIIVAIVMLLRGFADAIMMRSQQALASAGEAGFLPPHHYDQIFTAHGVIMIFFVAMPFVIGLMNLVVPLHQQYDRRCQRHDLRWCVEQLRDEGFDQCFGCVESGVNGAG